MVLVASLLLLIVPGLLAAAAVVRSGGPGSRPDRPDRYAEPRRLL